MGWERILFLDDDVRGFDSIHLDGIGKALTGHPGDPEAMGWAADEFPDNSTVCHAYRRAGGHQDTFIGGGALAVKISRRTPHFPRVYNEDWMFMLPMILRRRSSLAFAGTVRQEDYDPFAVPEQAAQQEFGDVLAEGVFRLLHCRHPVSRAASESYWRDQLAMRLDLIRRIRARLRTLPQDQETISADVALDQAVDMNRRIGDRPLQLAEWFVAWQEDCVTWRRRTEAAPPCDHVDEAFAALGLQPTRLHDAVSEGVSTPTRRSPPGATSQACSGRASLESA
jgi:hypothetical protein